MSEITRRQAITQLAAAFAAAAAVDYTLARSVHAQVQAVAADGSTAKGLSPKQFRTLERLTDLIIPVEHDKPGALQAAVPGWIDALINVSTDLKTRYDAGLAWLDAAMLKQGGDFLSATPAQQTALLDVIAFKENRTAENATGVDFFTLLRRMTVDGFFTSDIGIRDLNPAGRAPHATFVVPQEAVDYVISRSPFRG